MIKILKKLSTVSPLSTSDDKHTEASWYLFDKHYKREKLLAKDSECYRVKDIIANIEFHFFGVAELVTRSCITGCDTTSAVHIFGKISVFEKLKSRQYMHCAYEMKIVQSLMINPNSYTMWTSL